MKKQLFIIVFLIFLSQWSIAQPKLQFGLTTECSWFMPSQYDEYAEPNQNGWGAGLGVYTSRNIFWRFSADIGLSYRFKQMQQHYTIYTGGSDYGNSGDNSGYAGYDDGSNTTVEGWEKYQLHYVVLPLHLQLLAGKSLFFRGGIEASWLTNYDAGNDKTEYNWSAGFGSQKHKLKWSVNYIRGFKEVSFRNGLYTMEDGKYFSATAYQNQMLQLNLSYPIWQKK